MNGQGKELERQTTRARAKSRVGLEKGRAGEQRQSKRGEFGESDGGLQTDE